MENSPYQEKTLEETTKKEIATINYRKWNDALLSKDPQKVAQLYSVDAVFLPTFSKDLKYGRFDAETYFQNFLRKNPKSEVVDEKIKILGPKSYIHTGLYNFEVKEEDGNHHKVEARFTFTWLQNETSGKWEIVSHHSSVLP